jgi:integrase
VLTDLTIKSLPFEDRQRDYPDRDGVFLRIGRNSKTFMVATYQSGLRKRIAIGRYPEWSLAKARAKAAELRLDARRSTTEPLALTFSEALAQYTRLHIPTMRPSSQRQAVRLLSKFPHLANRKLPDIRTSEIAASLDRITAPSERMNAHKYLAAFLTWSFRRGYIDHQPHVRLNPPGASVERERVLSDTELVRIWNAAQGPFGAYIRLLVLSAQRKSQFLKFDTAWIEGDTIVFPDTCMKAAKTHIIPLTPYMQQLLDETPFAFSEARHKARLMAGSGTEEWHVHDLRRSTSTKLAEDLSVPWHLIARLLSHATPGITTRYVRATYIQELRAALLAWENHLRTLGCRF